MAPNNEPSQDEASGEEAAADNQAAAASPPEGEAGPRRPYQPLPYASHYMYGRSIRLSSTDSVAMRYRGHVEGVAISSQSLQRGHHFRFRVQRVTSKYTGAILCIGAVATLPNEVPLYSAPSDTRTWFAIDEEPKNRKRYNSRANLKRYIEVAKHICEIKRLNDAGRLLDDITENSVVTLRFQFNNELMLDVNGTSQEVIGVIPRMFTHIYPAIDLYGRIIQVSILLHPHVMLGGTSIDLPVIMENFREDTQETPDEDDYDADDDDDDNDDDDDDSSDSGRAGNPGKRNL